ncbi:MAG: hypothetical protein VX347_03355 [Bacteroidota bacterium]|nr:hypothetical protein [Bacteroidota bacterium]
MKKLFLYILIISATSLLAACGVYGEQCEGVASHSDKISKGV